MYHVPLVVRAPGQREGHRITDLATLSRFPDAVRAMALGDGNADGSAFASPTGLSSRHRPPSARQCARRPNGSVATLSRSQDMLAWSTTTGPATRSENGRRGATVPTNPSSTAVAARSRTAILSRRRPEPLRQRPVRRRGYATPLDGYTEFEDASDTQFAGDLDDRLEALGYK